MKLSLYENLRTDLDTNNLIINLKRCIKYIGYFIKDNWRGELVFIPSLLSFRTVKGVYVPYTNLGIKEVDTSIGIQKQGFFLSIQKTFIKMFFILVVLLTSLSVHGQDYYITTEDLNLWSGAESSYSSTIVLEKGDTVELLEKTDEYWVKVQCQGEIGFIEKGHLQRIEASEETEVEGETESESGFSTLFIFFLMAIVISIFLNKKGEKKRYKSTAIVLSFFFGFFGFQKFYLGKVYQGIFSILFSWTYLPTVIGFVDAVRLLIMKEMEFDDLYNQEKDPYFQLMKRAEKEKLALMKRAKKGKLELMKRAENGKLELMKRAKKKEAELKPKVLRKGSDLSQSKQDKVDDTIIDINSEDLDLSIEHNRKSETLYQEPPYWRHTYIYSFYDIEEATKEQKKYYLYLKNKVIDGEYVDLHGNTNYAFILFFDFLNEYKNHKDINLLDQLFKLLGKISPETIEYSSPTLQEELEKISNEYSIDNLKQLKAVNKEKAKEKAAEKIKKTQKNKEPNPYFEYSYKDYDPDAHKLGAQYKSKLGLTKKETALLNKFYAPSNTFTSIEGCCVAIIRIYLAVFKDLEINLKKRKTDIDLEFKQIFDKVSKIEKLRFNRYNKEYEKAWALREFKEKFYITFFKTIENLVREQYGNNRQLSVKKYHPYSKSESFIDEIIGNEIQALIIEKMDALIPPDLDTLIVLNKQGTNRWKIEFERLKNDFKKEDEGTFIDAIGRLEEVNQKNSKIGNIFFEASKFIAKYNKVEALNYYAKYIYYNLKTENDNKKLTKAAQKTLFKTEKQKSDFQEIIDDLIKTKNLKIALGDIPEIYIIQRKKIKFDHSEIQNIESKHEGTVELLNEYLVDEKEKTVPEIEASLDEVIEIETTLSGENSSIYISEINMNQVQEELVKMIVNNSYEIQQNIVESYAIENGMFKNQLIDCINEACEACLEGEALIEEEDENYIIEKSYYTEITK
jgi:TM2 domain-containing membrane protein YozV